MARGPSKMKAASDADEVAFLRGKVAGYESFMTKFAAELGVTTVAANVRAEVMESVSPMGASQTKTRMPSCPPPFDEDKHKTLSGILLSLSRPDYVDGIAVSIFHPTQITRPGDAS
jgi:hypothetical protein